MTRDYAKKSRPAAAKTSKKKAPAKRSQVPAWVWLFTGSVLGAFIMFLAFLSGLTPTPDPVQPPTAAATNPAQPSVPKPRFDFYQLLKETEVVVKEDPADSRPDNRPNAPPQEFILQVGSFKKIADADRLRAELILMNLDVQVETVTVRNGETWHRVLVGPYTSQSKVASARSTLISNNINPLLLKRNRS